MTEQRTGGAITILFTDLEESTDLRTRLGDEASQCLFDLHETIVRREIAAHGGREVKALGDGFMVAFVSARQALACAVAIQRAFEEHNRAHPAQELHVRMGLNSGEVLHQGDDLMGVAVHAAARIAARARGDEILMADVVRQLAGPIPEVVLRDRGRVPLKGFPERWRLHELVWRTEAAQRRVPVTGASGPQPRAALPVPPTPLLGREQEVGEITALLNQEGVRLVTVTGPGGVGKTRVALAVAESVASHMPDEAIFVPLAAITEAELVAPAIAHALGLRQTRGPRLFERVMFFLRDRELLLVLDNFEQVVRGAPVVGELLAACPRLAILVTSRAVLRLSGEHEYPLAPLPSSPAVALFVERARAIRPDLDLRPATDAIGEVCSLLDRLPLAIELAAACVRLFPVEEIRRRLDDRLELLASGARDLPARQRTLRSTIDWSYDLLDESGQALFRRLSVFVGGFTLEAAAALLGTAPTDAALAWRLDELVGQSLLQRAGDAGSEVRLTMLETVAAYGRERLRGSEEETPTRRAHAAFFLGLAEVAEPRLVSAEWEHWVDQLERDHDNLRAALRYCLDRGLGDWALRLAAALSRFWFLHGDLAEGRRWLREALVARDESTPEAQVRALAGTALLALEEHDYEAAGLPLEESLVLCRRLGDFRLLARVLGLHATAARYTFDYLAARRLYEEALALARESGDQWFTAHLLEGLGASAMTAEDTSVTRAALDESVTLFRELGDESSAAVALQYLGWQAALEGDVGTAASQLQESLQTHRRSHNRRGIAHAAGGVGYVALLTGDLASARAHLEEALQAFAVVDRMRALTMIVVLAGVAAAEGDHKRAARLLGAVEALSGPGLRRLPNKPFRAIHAQTWREVAGRLATPELEAAMTEGRALSLEQAIETARRRVDPSSRSEAGLSARELEVLRLVAEGLGNAEIAARLFVSIRTVHAHLRTIYSKLGVRSRTAAARSAIEHGLV